MDCLFNSKCRRLLSNVNGGRRLDSARKGQDLTIVFHSSLSLDSLKVVVEWRVEPGATVARPIPARREDSNYTLVLNS